MLDLESAESPCHFTTLALWNKLDKDEQHGFYNDARARRRQGERDITGEGAILAMAIANVVSIEAHKKPAKVTVTEVAEEDKLIGNDPDKYVPPETAEELLDTPGEPITVPETGEVKAPKPVAVVKIGETREEPMKKYDGTNPNLLERVKVTAGSKITFGKMKLAESAGERWEVGVMVDGTGIGSFIWEPPSGSPWSSDESLRTALGITADYRMVVDSKTDARQRL